MSKYSPLASHLEALAASEVRLTFKEIEEILGDSLPASAHKFKAWWANQAAHPSHPWATEWMEAGWMSDGLCLSEEWVRFKRVE